MLPYDFVEDVAICVRHLVASFDNFVKTHRRAHSLPGTNVPQVCFVRNPWVYRLVLDGPSGIVCGCASCHWSIHDSRCTSFGGRSVESYEIKHWGESRRDKRRPFVIGQGQAHHHMPTAHIPNPLDCVSEMSMAFRDVSNRPLVKHLGWSWRPGQINLYFADFKSSGSNYGNIPDVVGLQDVAGNTTTKMVGESKVPWVDDHNLQAAVYDLPSLRQKTAQPVQDMRALGCEYGFISTYNHTIFLRQFQSPSGDWEVWYSPPISSSSYYLPTVPNPQGTYLVLPRVSMKQCMFYVCTLASAANPVNNQTAPWVIYTH